MYSRCRQSQDFNFNEFSQARDSETVHINMRHNVETGETNRDPKQLFNNCDPCNRRNTPQCMFRSLGYDRDTVLQ